MEGDYRCTEQMKRYDNFLPMRMPCKTESHFRPANRKDTDFKPLEYWLAGYIRHKERLTGSCGYIKRYFKINENN